MKEITPDLLRNIAKRLMFNITDQQIEEWVVQFQDVIDSINNAQDIEGLNDVEPMSYPFDLMIDALREDVPSKPLCIDDVLSNAKEIKDNQISIPRVIK